MGERDILKELSDFRMKKEMVEKFKSILEKAAEEEEIPKTLGISVTDETNTGDGLA